MKTILIVTFLLVSALVRGQELPVADSLVIASQIDDWNRAWKIKDHELAAKWYSKDAEFTNAFGFSMIGRRAIEQYLAQVFRMDFVMAGESEQTSLRLVSISDNVILAVSTISRLGQKMEDSTDLGPRSTTHHRVFKKDGEWIIVSHLISDARSTFSRGH